MESVKWHQTLASKFVFTLCSLILLLGIIIGTAEFINDRRLLNNELKNNGLFLSFNLAHSLSEDIINEDEWHIYKELKRLVEREEIEKKGIKKLYPVVYAQVKNKKDKLKITYDPQKLIPQQKKTSSFSKNNLPEFDYSINSKTIKGESFYEIIVPIYYIQEKVGSLKIGLTKRYLESVLWETKIKILGIVGIFSLVGITIALILSQSITSPIVKLSQVSLLIAKGKLSKRISLSRNDEIGILYSSFNFMAERLEKFTRALKEKNKELARKNLELESFAYSISHDLKNPLISIQGLAHILNQNKEKRLSSKELYYLDRIKKNSEFMQKLINDILELSRLSKGEKKVEKVPLLEIINNVLHHYQGELKRKEIKVVLPEQMETVNHHPQRLYQVFSNLIGNAIKFMGNQTDKEIRIAEENKGNYLQIMVKDNGIGIDKTYHQKIFEPFQSLKKAEKTSGGGSGIGLTIVKRIIENYGGQIWVESESGKGTVFYFTLSQEERISP